MNDRKAVINVLKLVSVGIVDIVTFLLVFSVWALFNLSVFPWVLIAITFALMVVNLIILFSENGIKVYGVGAYASMLATSIMYYLFVMIYTGFVYLVISPRSYVITFLIVTLAYVVIMAGLYSSGINHSNDMIRQNSEKVRVIDINVQLMNIEEGIISCSKNIEKDKQDALVSVFEAMKERLLASTPFGRISKPNVLDLEDKLTSKFFALNETVQLLSSVSDKQDIYESVIQSISEIKTLVVNREKMILL